MVSVTEEDRNGRVLYYHKYLHYHKYLYCVDIISGQFSMFFTLNKNTFGSYCKKVTVQCTYGFCMHVFCKASIHAFCKASLYMCVCVCFVKPQCACVL